MSSLQRQAARNMLKAFLNKTTYPMSLEVALFSGDDELIGNGYSRIAITFPSTFWGQAGNTLFNASALQWQASADWLDVTSVQLINSVDQVVIFKKDLSPAKTILRPNVFRIPAGQMTLSREPTSNWTNLLYYKMFLAPVKAGGIYGGGNQYSIYFNLYTSPPDMSGSSSTGTECTGSGYSAALYNNGWVDTPTGIANAADIVFPEPTANDWNIINSVAMTKFEGGSDIMAVVNIPPIDPGSAQIKIAAGSLTFDAT